MQTLGATVELRYFETSAVNYLADSLRIGDAIATRPFQEVRGRAWVISPVVLWEILLTSDAERREELISFCQRLFHRELLPSPEEFVVGYIERGCPTVEPAQSLRSAGDMAVVWRDLCEFPEKTVLIDYDELKKRASILQQLVRDIHRVARGESISLIKYGPQDPMDLSLEEAIGLMPSISKVTDIDPEERLLYKIGIFYALILLCAQIGPDPAPVQAFWERVGIDATLDRLRYLLKTHEACVMRGPIAAMAYMTKVQCSTKYSRGVYFDSLHATYLPCVHHFFAEDPHFVLLRRVLTGHINSLKIHRVSEARWTFEDRKNPPDGSIIRT